MGIFHQLSGRDAASSSAPGYTHTNGLPACDRSRLRPRCVRMLPYCLRRGARWVFVLWTGSAIKIAVRVATIQQTNRLNQDESVFAVRVALDTLCNVVAGKQAAILIPAFLCDTCFRAVSHILMVTCHEPCRVDAGELNVVVRHGDDRFEVPALMWKALFKRGERRWLAAPHQQQESTNESCKERSNANKNNSQYLLPSWSWQRWC